MPYGYMGSMKRSCLAESTAFVQQGAVHICRKRVGCRRRHHLGLRGLADQRSPRCGVTGARGQGVHRTDAELDHLLTTFPRPGTRRPLLRTGSGPPSPQLYSNFSALRRHPRRRQAAGRGRRCGRCLRPGPGSAQHWALPTPTWPAAHRRLRTPSTASGTFTLLAGCCLPITRTFLARLVCVSPWCWVGQPR
jgi:hypothetical protein